jgi:hypothetical protein
MAITVSILTGGTNSHTESAANANAIATDFIAQGVLGAITPGSGSTAPCTGSMALNAQGSPNATTQVTAGTAYVAGTPTGSTSQTFRVVDSSGATVSHTANASGGTRYDWVYLKLDPDKLLNPAADASDVATYVTSRSTSNTTDNGTPPTFGYCIGIVTLANGFSTVSNSNITDKRSQTQGAVASTAWQAWTPTFTGFSASPSVTAARYIQIGKTVYLTLQSTAGTSNANSFTFTLPVAAKSTGNFMVANITDNTVTAAGVGMVALLASSTTATVYKDGASTAWTTSGSKNANIGLLIYEAA